MVERNQIQLPQYQSHKKVRAAKITAIIEAAKADTYNNKILIFGEIRANQPITLAWFNKYSPEIGGYYVMYKDGYTSHSPGKAFEEGNSLIE